MRSKLALPHILEPQLGSIVFAYAVATVFALWWNSNDAWVHPELIPIGNKVDIHKDGLLSTLLLLFDYRLFDANPHRLRLFSDLFEIIDAATRPYLALVYAHPTLTVTTVVYASLVPWFTFRSLRIFGLTTQEALLACAVLVTSPGFLTNLFVYIRPAKPLSFVLLAYTILWLAHYAKRLSTWSVFGMIFIVIIGDFTDELLYWNVFFVGISMIIVGGLKVWRQSGLLIVLSNGAFVLLLLVVLPYVYALLGTDGPRSISFQYSEGEYTAAGNMLLYLVTPHFYGAALVIGARSLATHIGIVASEWPMIAAMLAVLTAVAVAIAVVGVKNRESVAWRLAALGLLGFVSFTTAGMWLLWFLPSQNDYMDLISLNYYYNSPASLFISILAGAGVRLLRSATASWIVGVGIMLVMFTSVTTFQYVNNVIRFVHLGPTDTSSIFEALNAPHGPPRIIVTGDKVRFEREYRRYNDSGYRLFGSTWESREPIYRPQSYFDEHMQWFGGSYTTFGQAYGEGLCAAFVRSNCPVIFLGESPE